jgi:hypothetical protein
MTATDANDFDSRFMEITMKKWLIPLLGILFILPVQISFAQGVRVGPDGEFSQQTLKLPYAFYNENFGFAGGFVYGKVGSPQKQATGGQRYPDATHRAPVF